MPNFSIRLYTLRKNVRIARRRFWYKVQDLWMSARRVLFTRIIPVAIECSGCDRLMPVEFKDIAKHIRFYGREHRKVVLCDSCANRESILDIFYDDDDDYDDFDGVHEVSEMSFSRYLIIMPDGRLGLSEVSGYKYDDQDWGETGDDQWTDDSYPLLNTKRPFLKALVSALKHGDLKMPTKGKPIDITGFDEDYLDVEDSEADDHNWMYRHESRKS